VEDAVFGKIDVKATFDVSSFSINFGY